MISSDFMAICDYLLSFEFKGLFWVIWWWNKEDLQKLLRHRNQSKSISSNSLGQLKISGHDGDSLGVDGAEVSVFKEGN